MCVFALTLSAHLATAAENATAKAVPASQPEQTVAAGSASSRPEQTVAAGSASSQPETTGLVRLELKLPRPAFAGTPKNAPPGTTVEKPSGKPRPPLWVPPGVTNMALGKPVTASDKEPVIGELPLVTDGGKEAADGSWVELGPGLQWVQIDLGQPVEIHAVLVWHCHSDPRVYHDVVVQAADDPDFVANVRTLFNNDQDNSAGLGVGKDREYFETFEGKLIGGGRAVARYLRLYSKGSTASEMNHCTEVEVYGLPLPSLPALPAPRRTGTSAP